MARGTLDVAAELVRLKELTIFDLRQEWRRLERLPPPMRLSRDLLVRGIVYKLQERAFGGLSKSMLRRLTKGAHRSRAGESRGSAAAIVTKPGTRLVREWCGVTHSVLVLADGVESAEPRVVQRAASFEDLSSAVCCVCASSPIGDMASATSVCEPRNARSLSRTRPSISPAGSRRAGGPVSDPSEAT